MSVASATALATMIETCRRPDSVVVIGKNAVALHTSDGDVSEWEADAGMTAAYHGEMVAEKLGVTTVHTEDVAFYWRWWGSGA